MAGAASDYNQFTNYAIPADAAAYSDGGVDYFDYRGETQTRDFSTVEASKNKYYTLPLYAEDSSANNRFYVQKVKEAGLTKYRLVENTERGSFSKSYDYDNPQELQKGLEERIVALNIDKKFGKPDAQDLAARLNAVGVPAFVSDSHPVISALDTKLGDKTGVEKLLADLQRSNEEYYQQFQDKLGGLGGQLFLRENIRQLVLKSKKDELQIGWRKRPVESSTGKKPENKEGGRYPYGLKALSCHNPESLFHFMMTDTTKQLIAFQNGTPAMFSALIPQIRLYFIYPNGDEAQIPFSMYKESLSGQDPTKILTDRQGRGDDVGLISFDWKFQGGKAGAALSSGGAGDGTGQATLKLFFESADSIIKKRRIYKSTNEKVDFAYEQLLTKNVIDYNNNEVRFFNQGRIRAIVKYGYDESFAKTIPNSSSFFKAAKEMAIVLNLNPALYELDFNDSGGVTMSIDYQHSVELNLQDPKLNIFGGKLEIAKQKYEEGIAEVQSIQSVLDITPFGTASEATPSKPEEPSSKNETLAAKLAESEAKLEADFLVAQNEVYGALKERILKGVYKTELTRGSLQNYLTIRQIDPAQRPNVNASLWNSQRDFNINKIEFAQIDSNLGEETILQGRLEDTGEQGFYWVYFGDIIDAMLQQDNIKERLKQENITIILGQIVIPETLRGENGTLAPISVALNLADVPISLELWNQFFTEHIVKPKVTNIDFFSIVRKMITNLIHPFLNNQDVVGVGNLPRTSTVQVNFYTGEKKKIQNLFRNSNRVFVDDIAAAYLGSPISTNPINKTQKANVCFIGGGFDHTLIGVNKQNLIGNEEFDQKLGIMHYYIARDRGFVKEAQFVKEGIPYAREINVAESYNAKQSHTPKTAFWEPFNVNLEMFGNPNVRFNTVFFLQPTLPGIGSFSDPKSAAYRLQIGGYHSAMEISNSVTPQGWTTSINGNRLDPISGKLASPATKTNKIYPRGKATEGTDAGGILS